MWARRAQSSGKQQFSDEFLHGFRACEETPKVEETAVCSDTDVDAVWQVLFCPLRSMMLKKMENNVGARALDAAGDGEV